MNTPTKAPAAVSLADKPPETLRELIAQLQEIEAVHGGDIPVATMNHESGGFSSLNSCAEVQVLHPPKKWHGWWNTGPFYESGTPEPVVCIW
ncbi:hypothetical protein [Ramlibacter alkalitolerans]|uniref:Uncharacterized protein n=1 Tax=Ramlibacter alkalitolerans TaxID=2039631 RepID=A0ABS1JU17_9BURK|nr:hypothetical protein [Ramlibacter alkalitolerans]MBL0427697.1 hypothetical protein [Ramlibacter alkalitolerans]